MIRDSMVKGAFLMIFAVLSLSVSAQAGPPADGSPDTSRPYPRGPARGTASSSSEVAVSINGDDRNVITAFIADDYRQKCSDEADQKKNKCPSPEAEKKYSLGSALPNDIGATNIPDKLRAELKPETGHQFVQVNGDVLLVKSSSKIIVDAVTLASALGN